jgi:EpsI family protein
MARQLRHAPSQERANRHATIEVSSPWRATGRDVYPWTPKFLNPATEFVQTYTSGGHAVRFYAARYDARQAVVKLSSRGNALFGDPWTPLSRSSRTAIVGGRSVQVGETVLDSSRGSIIVWNWYVVDGSLIDSPLVAQVLFAKSRLFGRARDAAAIAVATEVQEENEARAILQDFVGHLTLAGPAIP